MAATRSGFELETLGYQPNSSTYRFEYDPDTTPPSMAVVTAVSTVMEADPLDLGPLNDILNCDALDKLMTAHNGRSCEVQFTCDYEGHSTTISSNGVVAVTPYGGDEPDERDGSNDSL